MSSDPLILEPKIPPSEAPFLLDPLNGYPLTADAEAEQEASSAYQALRLGSSDLTLAEGRALALLERDASFPPAAVLLAEVRFLLGDFRAVVDRLQPIVTELPDYLAAQVLLGRALEKLGDPLAAFDAYQGIAGASRTAAERADELRPRVVEITLLRFQEELEQGRTETAEELFATLQTLAPEDAATLEARWRLSVAQQDLAGELEAVGRLAQLYPERRELLERRVDLQLELGDIRGGLEGYETLVERFPEDAALEEKLERAKLLWRLQVLPKYVQDLTQKSVLRRADFATLLYWLVPEVRFAQVSNPPIATDILDHPRRDEIVRVMNLDLMAVDETLHSFSPHDNTTRVAAFRALLGLLARSDREIPCLGRVRSQLTAPREMVCRRAADCGLVASPADCLPGAPISGPEALDFFRQTLDLLETP